MKRFSETIAERWTGRHDASLEMAGVVSGETILDIGCSYGWFEEAVLKRDCRLVVGIDINRRSLAAAARAVPVAVFLQGGFPDLPFRDAQFDRVVMWEVLEHLAAREAAGHLRAVRRTLKPGGRLFLSVPKFDLRSTLGDPAWYLGHRHYTEKALISVLARGGFHPLRIRSAGGPFEVLSMLLFYPCKWLGGVEVPGKNFLEKRRRREYQRSRGWSTYFVEAEKILD